jgi:hypothetical protein
MFGMLGPGDQYKAPKLLHPFRPTSYGLAHNPQKTTTLLLTRNKKRDSKMGISEEPFVITMGRLTSTQQILVGNSMSQVPFCVFGIYIYLR